MLSRLHGQFVRVLVFVAAAALPAAAHDTIQVAQDEAGKLVGHAHFDDVVVYLPESVFPGFDGFAGPDPGVEALIEDDPDEGLFVLPSTVNIELVLISADPVMRVWNGSAFLAPGDALVLGAPYFHLHPV